MAKHMSSVAKGTPATWDSYIPTSGPGGVGPTYWWKMAETSGSTANDSADSNNGGYVNSPTLDQPGIIPATSDPCPSFNGSNQYMQATGTAVLFPSSSITLAMAFESSSPTGSLHGICGLASTLTYTEMAFCIDTSGKLVMGSDDGAASFHSVTSASSVLDGNPHLGVFVFVPSGVGGTFTAYLDGVSFGTFTLSNLTTPGGPLATCGWATFGTATIAYYFPGKLQSFLVYDVAFASGDVANLYSAFTA